MTDLDRFIELYTSFGVKIIAMKRPCGTEIMLGSSHFESEVNLSTGDKLEGVSCSLVRFDHEGKFIWQWFGR